MRAHPARLAWVASATVLSAACVTAAPPADETDRAASPFGALVSDASAGDACTGLACRVKSCKDEDGTTISGTVYAPNGTLPVYNATVYIPNGKVTPPKAGVTCNTCGSPLSGEPITVATTDATGAFTLKNAPSGKNIPIVVQLGKWQRSTVLPTVIGCTSNALTDPNLTRLPKTQAEGSMPHIALTTGECDQMGCVLPKLGIDPSEFGFEGDGRAKAVNTYLGGGTTKLKAATPADDLWSSPTLLSTYDMAIFSCECSESLSTKGGTNKAPEFGNVTNYLAEGGRVLTSDFQYTWYKYSPDPNLGGVPIGNDVIGIGEIKGGAPIGGSPITLDTGFTDGAALADWLLGVFPGSTYGSVTPDVVFSNIQSLNATTVKWAHSPTPTGPRAFTVRTPAGSPKQCGQGTHVDFHVDNESGDQVACEPGVDGGTVCYPKTCSTPLSEGEAMVAFYFFQMSACLP